MLRGYNLFSNYIKIILNSFSIKTVTYIIHLCATICVELYTVGNIPSEGSCLKFELLLCINAIPCVIVIMSWGI